MTSLGDFEGADQVFFICEKLLEYGVVIDGDNITTQRKRTIKYTNASLQYCIQKLFYTLKYKVEEDFIIDMVIEYKFIFDEELIEVESAAEEEEESEEEEEEESEEEDANYISNKNKNEALINEMLEDDATDKAYFLNNAVKKIKNK